MNIVKRTSIKVMVVLRTTFLPSNELVDDGDGGVETSLKLLKFSCNIDLKLLSEPYSPCLYQSNTHTPKKLQLTRFFLKQKTKKKRICGRKKPMAIDQTSTIK